MRTPLRRHATVAVLTGFWLCTAAGAEPATQPASAPGAPKMQLNPTIFDFGQVFVGAPATREFTIRNVGDAPLNTQVRSSCGCTVATTPKTPLAPGEETNFTITYNTRHKGQANKNVTLMTDDPERPHVVIRVIGEVKPLFDFEPAVVMFNNIAVDSEETTTVRIRNATERPVRLSLKEGQQLPKFEFKLAEVTPGVEYSLTVTTRPPLANGTNPGNVVFETDHPDLPTMDLQLMAYVQPRVVITPTRLFIAPPPGESGDRIVRVRYRKEKPLTVTGVRLGEKPLDYKAQPTPELPAASPYAEHVLQLKLPGFEELPASGLKLVVTTDDPAYQKVEVSVMRRPGGAGGPRATGVGAAGGDQGKPTSQPAGGAGARKRY